jgi:hypothetical protein
MLIPSLLPLLGFSFPQGPRMRALLNTADDNLITKALRTYPTPKRNQIVILVIKAIDRATDVIATSRNLQSYNLSHAIEIARQQSAETESWTAKVDPAVFKSFLVALRTARLRALSRTRTRTIKASEGSYAAKLANAVDRFNLEVERSEWSGAAPLVAKENGSKEVEGEGFDFSAPIKKHVGVVEMDEEEEGELVRAVQELVKAVKEMQVEDVKMEEDVTMDGMME